MILVRHGLMLVGLPFSGKTKCYHALGHALGLVSEKVITSFIDLSFKCFRFFHSSLSIRIFYKSEKIARSLSSFVPIDF